MANDGSDNPLPERSPDDRRAFKRELTEVVPHLRAFARGLCGRPDMADDLVQETLLQAWAAQDRFEPGTSMRAWTFVILRNAFLSDRRRLSNTMETGEEAVDAAMSTPASQDRRLVLGDLQRALMQLPEAWREAVVLVGAGGMSYQEAADICGCAVGTVKSRVSRARSALRSW